jgi:hypothetical protein
LDPQEDQPWFRGVHNEGYELVPGIYRGKDVLGWEYSRDSRADAEDMKAEFARRAVPFLKDHQHFHEGEYLALMQHYRYPTRLLDWTEGALIALYFAIRASKGARPSKPCVWMLNPSWLNSVNDALPENNDKSLVRYIDYWAMKKYPEDRTVMRKYLCREEKLTAKYPVAVFPPHIDVRIVAQKSAFTIHGRKKNGFRNLAEKHQDAQIAKILITSDSDEIWDDLVTLGVTETKLFPDLDGLSREIQGEYGMKVVYP